MSALAILQVDNFEFFYIETLKLYQTQCNTWNWVLVYTESYFVCNSGCKQVAAAIALNLAVFSHILKHTLTRLQTSFYEAKNPSFPPKTEPEDASTTFTDNPAGINHNSVILSGECSVSYTLWW